MSKESRLKLEEIRRVCFRCVLCNVNNEDRLPLANPRYVQIDFVAGRADLIRKMVTQKIQNDGNTRYEPQRETR
jgi:hypothetical protein